MSDAEFLQFLTSRDFARIVVGDVVARLTTMQQAFQEIPSEVKQIKFPADEDPMSVRDLETQMDSLYKPVVDALNKGQCPTGQTVDQLLMRLHNYAIDAAAVLRRAAESRLGGLLLTSATEEATELVAYATSLIAMQEAHEYGRSQGAATTHAQRQRTRSAGQTERE